MVRHVVYTMPVHGFRMASDPFVSRKSDAPNQSRRKETIQIAFQLLTALNYVHAKGYCHTDCKPENVLLAPRRDGRLQLTLIDFGSSIRESDPHPLLIGTPQYRSPEVIITLYI